MKRQTGNRNSPKPNTLEEYLRDLEGCPPRAFIEGASILRVSQRTDEALNIIEQGLKHWPEDLGILTEFAWVLQERRDHKRALQAFDRLISFEPSNNCFLVCAASHARQLGELKKAHQYLDQALESCSTDIYAIVELLELFSCENDFESAWCFLRTQEMNVFEDEHSSHLAFKVVTARWKWLIGQESENEQQADSFEELLKYCQQFQTLSPNEYRELARLSLESGQLDEALHFLYKEYISSIGKGSVCVHTNKGSAPLEESFDAYQRAVEISQTDVLFLKRAVQLCREYGDYPMMRKCLLQIAEQDPNDPTLKVEIAICLKLEGKINESLVSFRDAQSLEKCPASAFFECASMLRVSKDLSQARLIIQEGLARYPQDFNMRVEACWVFQEQGEHARALREFEEVLRHQPDNVCFLTCAGVHARETGDRLRARQFLQRAIAIAGADSAVVVELWTLLLQEQSWIEAWKLYQVADEVLIKTPRGASLVNQTVVGLSKAIISGVIDANEVLQGKEAAEPIVDLAAPFMLLERYSCNDQKSLALKLVLGSLDCDNSFLAGHVFPALVSLSIEANYLSGALKFLEQTWALGREYTWGAHLEDWKLIEKLQGILEKDTLEEFLFFYLEYAFQRATKDPKKLPLLSDAVLWLVHIKYFQGGDSQYDEISERYPGLLEFLLSNFGSNMAHRVFNLNAWGRSIIAFPDISLRAVLRSVLHQPLENILKSGPENVSEAICFCFFFSEDLGSFEDLIKIISAYFRDFIDKDIESVFLAWDPIEKEVRDTLHAALISALSEHALLDSDDLSGTHLLFLSFFLHARNGLIPLEELRSKLFEKIELYLSLNSKRENLPSDEKKILRDLFFKLMSYRGQAPDLEWEKWVAAEKRGDFNQEIKRLGQALARKTELRAFHSGPKIKLAVCISGQLRHYVQALPTLREFLGDERIEPHIFVHTWSFEGMGNVRHFRNLVEQLPLNLRRAFIETNMSEEKTAQQYPHLHKYFSTSPAGEANIEDLSRNFGIEPDRIVIEDDRLEPFSSFSIMEKMFYKIQSCHHLARASGIKFDLEMRGRPDSFYFPREAFSWQEIYEACQNGRSLVVDSGYFLCDSGYMVVGDMLAIGHPTLMDLYSCTYSLYPKITALELSSWRPELIPHYCLSRIMEHHNIQLIDEIPYGICPMILQWELNENKILAHLKEDSVGRMDETDKCLIEAAEADLKKESCTEQNDLIS